MIRVRWTIASLLTALLLHAAPPRDRSQTPMINETYNTRILSHQNGARYVVGKRTTMDRVLVIMVNFSDYSFVSSKADVDSMFNAQHWSKDGATGSIRQYFHDQSNGQYNPQFDVVGPVTLSRGYAYYGAGKSTTAKPGYMVTEACALVNDSVDFTQYDLNNDGKVDMVFVLFAGFGENDPPIKSLVADPTQLVWPHYSTISQVGCGNNLRVFDGKTIEDYECANELDGLYSTATLNVVAGIGVMVHEFCHGLGLPDLYSTSTKDNIVGKWSVLDYGPYNNDMHTPPSLTAYERWWMGWQQPTALNQAADIVLQPLSQGGETCYMTDSGAEIDNILNPSPASFYMLENRQQTGWDIGLPGKGLLLWKIKYSASSWSSNSVNANARGMGITILHADGIPDANGKQGDCFPYQGIDSITILPNYPISNIQANTDQSISFQVMGGASTPTEFPNSDCQPIVNKYIKNNQIVIERDGHTYTLLGIQQ